MKTCIEVVLTNKRCGEGVDFVYGNGERCYYHGKVHMELTTRAESIGLVDDDD